MNLTYEQMKEMNMVQLGIFRQFVSVCEELNLKYYMIHGSLLGTIRYDGFFPFDDDIDVAMPRKDYNTLLQYGQDLLSDRYFIQSYKSENRYPLPFAKIRDCNTSFIQPIMQNLSINQGIYIDVFPLDNYPNGRFKKLVCNLKNRFYGIRISERLHYSDKQPFWKKSLRGITKIICPSWEKAVQKRAELYSNIRETGLVITVGGKTNERGVDQCLFGEGYSHKFENMDVVCPSKSEDYLNVIYEDFEHYNPAEEYMRGDTVKISADYVSCKISYKEYMENK